MTTTVWRPALTPLEPLIDTLAVMNVRRPMGGLVPGLMADQVDTEPGWATASSVITGDGFEELIATARRRWQAPAHVAADDATLLGALRSSLVDRHLGPLVERIHDTLRLGRRTLWGSLADGVAHAVSRAGVVAEAPIAAATRVLEALGVADLVELNAQPDGQLFVARKTCCLAFALPEPKICAGCCIRTP